MKALFNLCTFAADKTYQSWLDNHEYREKANLPPLPPPQSPPKFDNLPSLSDSDFEKEDEDEDEPKPLTHRSIHFTSTTHLQGRAMFSNDEDDDDDDNNNGSDGGDGVD